MSQSQKVRAPGANRSGGQVVVFLLGAAAAVGGYASLHAYVPADSLLTRYVAGHWVEYVETWLFLWALFALAAKGWNLHRQRAALRIELLPAPSADTAAADTAQTLLNHLDKLPRRHRGTLAAARIRGALDFVRARGSGDGLDDHLRNQADADADAVDGSHALVRFITWAIPILGFLGTVLGITEAIANVTPEQLAGSITGVTDGLAIAFDTTAIALAYSMCIMFLSFILDRGEQSHLGALDRLVERELAHRFGRIGKAGNEVLAVLREGGDAVVRVGERLVQRQAELWSRSLDAARSRWTDAARQEQKHLAEALGRMMDQTLGAHQQRLAALEKKAFDECSGFVQSCERVALALRDATAGLENHGQRLAEHTAVLGRLADGEERLLALQHTLQQNLHALSHAAAFQQALHGLTAGIHLLTAHAQGLAAGSPGQARMVLSAHAGPPKPRQGQAA